VSTRSTGQAFRANKALPAVALGRYQCISHWIRQLGKEIGHSIKVGIWGALVEEIWIEIHVRRSFSTSEFPELVAMLIQAYPAVLVDLWTLMATRSACLAQSFCFEVTNSRWIDRACRSPPALLVEINLFETVPDTDLAISLFSPDFSQMEPSQDRIAVERLRWTGSIIGT